jgi:hypothetical protein
MVANIDPAADGEEQSEIVMQINNWSRREKNTASVVMYFQPVPPEKLHYCFR